MKSVLLSASALGLLAGVVLIEAAHAEAAGNAPTLKISGEINTAVYAFNQKDQPKDANGGKGQGFHSDVQDSRLNFEAVGDAHFYGGMEYSALVGFTANPEEGQAAVEEVNIRLRGPWGFFMTGNSRDVGDRMANGAFSVMGASGGFNGNYDRVINASTGVLPSVSLVGAPKDANKLTYVTPRVYDVQFGISFTPNTQTQGFSKLKSVGSRKNDDTTYDKNNVSLGLNYRTKFSNGLGLKASATAVFGQSQIARRLGALPLTATERAAETYFSGDRKNTSSYALGLELDYGAFELGFEFIDNGTSQVLKAIQGRKAGQVYSVAAGYKFGVNHIALGYLHATRKLGTGILTNFNGVRTLDVVSADNPRAKADVVSLTYDRNLAKGLVLFAEANYFDYKTDQRWVNLQNSMKSSGVGNASNMLDGVGNNRGHVLMLGTKVRF
ncbi:MAG: porin [Proteobacteria bacterium]|nr:porin [Pseudomonadota bacterium]